MDDIYNPPLTCPQHLISPVIPILLMKLLWKSLQMVSWIANLSSWHLFCSTGIFCDIWHMFSCPNPRIHPWFIICSCFPYVVDDNMFCFFYLLIWCVASTDFLNVKSTLHYRDKFYLATIYYPFYYPSCILLIC